MIEEDRDIDTTSNDTADRTSDRDSGSGRDRGSSGAERADRERGERNERGSSIRDELKRSFREARADDDDAGDDRDKSRTWEPANRAAKKAKEASDHLEYLQALKPQLDQREQAVAGLEARECAAKEILAREAALERREKQASHDDKELAHARNALDVERDELGRRVKQIRDLVHG